ncbi:MAG: tyrosine-type recombinase/integrase [Candidatus Baldrarchaeia archaeon]
MVLRLNNLSPTEFLNLPDDEIKTCIKRACLAKNAEGKYGFTQNMFYIILRFLEVNGRSVSFTKTEKRLLLKRQSKRAAKEYIPTREDIYRMVDSFPRRDERQWLRGRALILCLWQSGVRLNCLLSWTWGIFKDKLYPEPQVPVPIKVVAKRPEGVWNVAEDTKLSKYNVGYYYTFLHKEAAKALKEYLDARIRDGWIPRDSDPIWVTEGKGWFNKNQPLDRIGAWRIVKTAALHAGINPDTVWPHCFRKAFRKTLYMSAVDPDVAEALMGHKLPGSRGNYFDYHDVEFAKREYMKGFWDRIGINHVRKMEEEIKATREEMRKIKELILHILPEELRRPEDAEWFIETIRKRYEDRILQEIHEAEVEERRFQEEMLPRLREHSSDGSGKYVIIKGEEKLLEYLNQGWELVKELRDDRYLLKRG